MILVENNLQENGNQPELQISYFLFNSKNKRKNVYVRAYIIIYNDFDNFVKTPWRSHGIIREQCNFLLFRTKKYYAFVCVRCIERYDFFSLPLPRK